MCLSDGLYHHYSSTQAFTAVGASAAAPTGWPAGLPLQVCSPGAAGQAVAAHDAAGRRQEVIRTQAFFLSSPNQQHASNMCHCHTLSIQQHVWWFRPYMQPACDCCCHGYAANTASGATAAPLMW